MTNDEARNAVIAWGVQAYRVAVPLLRRGCRRQWDEIRFVCTDLLTEVFSSCGDWAPLQGCRMFYDVNQGRCPWLKLGCPVGTVGWD